MIATGDVVLSEWDQAVIAGMQLTAADRVLSGRLRESHRLEIVELRDRSVRIESRGWIGVVRLDGCTIRVEPVWIEGHRHLIELLDAVQRLDLVKSIAADTSFVARSANLFELMAWLLAMACDSVVRTGIQADYVPHFEDLTTLRGRLDVRAQVLRRWGRLGSSCSPEERCILRSPGDPVMHAGSAEDGSPPFRCQPLPARNARSPRPCRYGRLHHACPTAKARERESLSDAALSSLVTKRSGCASSELAPNDDRRQVKGHRRLLRLASERGEIQCLPKASDRRPEYRE